MKKFAFIFSFYMLLLSLVPCADATAHEETGEHEQTEEAVQQEHDDSHRDECTFFCSCSCCGHLISLQEPCNLEITIIPETIDTKIFFKQLPLQEYTLTFWQPPKI